MFAEISRYTLLRRYCRHHDPNAQQRYCPGETGAGTAERLIEQWEFTVGEEANEQESP
jgi:hypothetical protein